MKSAAIEENLELVQSTLEQWLSFQKYIKRSLNDTPSTSEEETSFLEIKSNISRVSRSLAEKIKAVGKVDFGEKTMRELLTKCVSVDHMNKLPPNDKRGLIKEAHVVNIRLTRSAGALKMLSEGYVPVDAVKSGKKKGKGGSKTLFIIGGVVVAVIIVAVFGLKFAGII